MARSTMGPAEGSTLELTAGPWDERGLAACAAPDGWTVRVPGVIPGERHRVGVTRRGRGGPVAWGESARLLDGGPAGAARQQPPCSLHGRCGGCGLQHVEPRAQQALLVDSLAAGLPEPLRAVLEPPERWIAAPPFGYRQKAVLLPHVEAGEVRLGGYGRGGHEVIDLPDCAVLAEPLRRARDRLLDALREPLRRDPKRARPPGYPSAPPDGGALRAVVLRGNAEGAVSVVFVVSSSPARGWLHDVALRCIGGVIVGVALQVFDAPSDAVSGDGPCEVLIGGPELRESVGGVSLIVPPLAFFQIAPPVLWALVERIRDWARVRGAGRFADLYCGVGAISLPLVAAAGGSVWGCDRAEVAIDAARRASAAAGLDARFVVGSPAETLDAAGPIDLAIVDPPRSGLRDRDREALLRAAPPSIAQVACSAPSLARDGAALMAAGYRPVALLAAAMMPQTPYLEWLALWEGSGT